MYEHGEAARPFHQRPNGRPVQADDQFSLPVARYSTIVYLSLVQFERAKKELWSVSTLRAAAQSVRRKIGFARSCGLLLNLHRFEFARPTFSTLLGLFAPG